MRSDAEGNWVTDVSLPSGRKWLIYINVCRPVIPVSCECTTECGVNAGMCATEVIDNKVVCYGFLVINVSSL